MRKGLIVTLLVICFTGTVASAVPQQINYQGYLTDTGGSPLDTAVAMTFKLYTDSTAGSLLWTETRPPVTVTDGLFNVRLGQLTALTDAILNNAQVWLGITVGNNTEMTPRSRIVSVGYSYRVGTVDGASGGTITGDVNIEGKGNLGTGNANPGIYAFVAGRSDTASGSYSTVGGGYENTASSSYATVGGGYDNDATGSRATVGGGSNNDATEYAATVSGGRYNRARGQYSVVSGGGGTSAVDSNSASGDYSAIGGGRRNTASGQEATVGGGYSNEADTSYATVSGGDDNTATGYSATVGGGNNNTASGGVATVGGGSQNTAGQSATVGGGVWNNASGDDATVGGGYGNSANVYAATVSGGFDNDVSGVAATIGGGYGNDATNDYAMVGGGRYNRARGLYSVVSGGGGSSLADSNSATGDYSAIGGGRRNTASGERATVGGGSSNDASGYHATVGGGIYNDATDWYATVGGGYSNAASGWEATVGGGNSNNASGYCAVIPGGFENTASARYAFAAGRRAIANDVGAFVWADSTDATFYSPAVNSFAVRASGGVRFATTSAGNVGVKLDPGDTAWEVLSDSTKKTNRRAANTQEILSKVARLPIEEWNYKHQDSGNTHIGPMAQEFYRLFAYGDDEASISTIDPDGIALAAIQELAKQNEELRTAVRHYDAELNNLRARVQTLEAGQQKATKEEK